MVEWVYPLLTYHQLWLPVCDHSFIPLHHLIIQTQPQLVRATSENPLLPLIYMFYHSEVVFLDVAKLCCIVGEYTCSCGSVHTCNLIILCINHSVLMHNMHSHAVLYMHVILTIPYTQSTSFPYPQAFFKVCEYVAYLVRRDHFITMDNLSMSVHSVRHFIDSCIQTGPGPRL